MDEGEWWSYCDDHCRYVEGVSGNEVSHFVTHKVYESSTEALIAVSYDEF